MGTHFRPPSRRRAALRTLAAAGAALAGARALAQHDTFGKRPAACVLTPAQTEGPYFVDERLERLDIRADPADGSVRPGVPLVLALRVSAIAGRGCEPLRDAIVDVWHCDATGLYSDENDAGAGSGTKGRKFLRGYQRCDANGVVRFTTIYPGAYPGRAVHLHFKVRATRGARRDEFTSQLYFEDALTDRVHAAPPYAGALRRRTRNGEDGLFRAGGRALILDARAESDGYVAAFDVGVRIA